MTPGAMAPIAIPGDVLAAIYACAIAAFPDECCGYLIGAAPGAVDAIVACRNAQLDGVHPIAPERGADTGFVIAGAELLGFARSFDTARPARIVYHSHTNGRAYFSTVDRGMAATAAGPTYPVQHVVVGVAAGAITEVAQFAWSDAARDFVEIARWPGDAAPGAGGPPA
jgi:proteasome lid subunit RPN8/RPN11